MRTAKAASTSDPTSTTQSFVWMNEDAIAAFDGGGGSMEPVDGGGAEEGGGASEAAAATVIATLIHALQWPAVLHI